MYRMKSSVDLDFMRF